MSRKQVETTVMVDSVECDGDSCGAVASVEDAYRRKTNARISGRPTDTRWKTVGEHDYCPECAQRMWGSV